LLNDLDNAGIRLQERPDDVRLNQQLADIQKRLENLLREPLPLE
jgi:hypothetical protein